VARPDLDAWLPDPSVRTYHRREAQATERKLWAAAGQVRLADSRMLGRLVRWRIPGEPARITFRELFATDPFLLLEHGQTHSVSGLVGRIWTLRRDYPHLEGPEVFRDWKQTGTVRVLFAHWTEPAGTGRSWLVSEVRIAAADRQARLGVRLVRPLIAAFDPLIENEALALAARRAEAASPGVTAS
jgi:hypothetical protein